MTSFWDGKARVGYAFDSAMVYGVMGGAIGVYDNDGLEQLDTYSFIYGVGIDTMVTDKIFIGVEYLYRDVVTDNSILIPTDHWEYRVDSLQVRIGYKFWLLPRRNYLLNSWVWFRELRDGEEKTYGY